MNFCLYLVTLENGQSRFSVHTSYHTRRPGNQAVNCEHFLGNGFFFIFLKGEVHSARKSSFVSGHTIVLEGVTVGTQTKLYLISLREFHRELYSVKSPFASRALQLLTVSLPRTKVDGLNSVVSVDFSDVICFSSCKIGAAGKMLYYTIISSQSSTSCVYWRAQKSPSCTSILIYRNILFCVKKVVDN